MNLREDPGRLSKSELWSAAAGSLSPNKRMHLTALRAAGDAQSVRPRTEAFMEVTNG